jgi:hypothetical protein
MGKGQRAMIMLSFFIALSPFTFAFLVIIHEQTSYGFSL